MKNFFRLSRVHNTPRCLFRVLKVLVRISLIIFKTIFYVPNSFCEVLEKFSRVFGEVFLIIGGERALIFKAPFPGCQHSVCEKVSLRGSVTEVSHRF